jgi:hypothetical protein
MTISPQDLSIPACSSYSSTRPPSFDFLHPCDASAASSSPLSPSQSRPQFLLPSYSATSLPGYSASLPVPDYHPNPTEDEQRLEFVPTRSIYGRSNGVWTKRVKDMTISLHNQDPIQVQIAPRYGKGGIIRGTIEFDEENLPAFEKVKLVVRLFLFSPRETLVHPYVTPLRLKGKYRSAANLMRDVRKFSSARASPFGESSRTLSAHGSFNSKSLSLLSNRGGSGWNASHLPMFATLVKEEGSPARTQCTSTLLRSPGTLSGLTGIGTHVICLLMFFPPFRFRKRR